MTLRLRLTLFYALLVAVILALSGTALHLLLSRSLLQGVDDGLKETANLIVAAAETEDGAPRLHNAEEVATQFSDERAAVLYDARGSVASRLGRPPPNLPRFGVGEETWGNWRVRTQALEAGTLTVLADLTATREAIRRFDLLFLLSAPLAVIAALLLGYALAGRALAPVSRLTLAARDLAKRRAWRERLPEPSRHDELWQLATGTNELLGALESVIQSERRFTADAAHELATPISLLQGRLEKGREQADDPDRARAAFDIALQANDELRSLIKSLLALARAESGQGLPATPVALDEIAFDVAAQLRPAFAAKGLELELDLPEEPVYVMGDAMALELALRNLVDNACKFSSSGTVIIRVADTGSMASFSVSDQGSGIDEAAIPHLFERFYQADVRHRQHGSGLGLALVQNIADWHGGSVTAENRPTGGAVFTLSLPRVPRAD